MYKKYHTNSFTDIIVITMTINKQKLRFLVLQSFTLLIFYNLLDKKLFVY